MNLQRGIERRLAGAVRDDLDSAEQPATANVADVMVIAEALGEALLEQVAHLPHTLQQPVRADDLLHRQRRRAGYRMGEIRMAMLEGARAVADRIDDAAGREHRADRLIAAAEPLGDCLEIGRNAFLLP